MRRPHERAILLQVAKRRHKIPDAIANQPDIPARLAIYWLAFWELASDRASPDAPIPWAVINDWGWENGLDADGRQTLFAFVRALDLVFLAWRRDNKPTGKGTASHGKPSGFRAKH